MLKNRYILLIGYILFLFLLFSACNMPGRNKPTQDTSGLIHTIAAMTVEAQLTLSAQETPDQEATTIMGEEEQMEPIITPSLTVELLPTNTQVPSATNTPVPTATQTPIPCNHVTFIKDVSVPDGSVMDPGQQFTKTWRLKNSGSCNWTPGYSLVFISGTSMGAPDSKQLTDDTVAPGDEIEVSVNLEAPYEPGTYRANFKLRNSDGIVFGLGDKSSVFYVEINVQDKRGVMLDFIAMAEDAKWGSGTGTITYTLPGDVVIPYGGPVSGTEAYVMTHKNVKLEDGRKSGSILETHPDNDGYIIGRYPYYLVGKGDKVSAKIGFLIEGEESCGTGDAVFQISYTIGDDLDTFNNLGSWHEYCDGSFRKISIDLSNLIGKSIRFYVIVSANGSAVDDKAVWDSFGVMR
jgi:hypothetical protein